MLSDDIKKRAMRILERRDMSEKEMYDRLVEKGEAEDEARECARWLVSLGLIDDERYSAMIVRHYAAKGYGISRIKNELYRRGIPKELWECALEERPESDDVLDRLLKSKLSGKECDRASLKKATDALARRGFSWEEIRSAVERYLANAKEEQNDV